MTHRIELDSVRKYRNASEWRNVNRARCGDMESIGYGDNIAKLCAMMLDAGMGGPVDVYRNETPVFCGKTIEQWASGKALTGEQPEHLRRARG